MPWVWGDEVKDLSSPSGAYHLVWSRDALPVRHRALGDGRPGRGPADRALALRHAADGRRLVPAELRRLRHAGLGVAPARRGRAADRARAPRRRGRRARPGAGSGRRRSFLVGVPGRGDRPAGAVLARRSGGRTSPATRPTRSPPRSPGSSARPSWPARTAPMRSRGGGSRSPTAGSANVKDWTVTSNGPLSDQPVLPAADQERPARHGQPRTRWATAARRRSTSARSSTRASSTWSGSACCRFDDPAVVNTLAVVDDELEVETPERVRSGGASATTGTARPAPAGSGRSPTRAPTRPSAAGGRSSPASAGEYAVVAGQDATPYLAAMAAASGPSDMLSEQVWDGRPPTGSACCAAGEGTRAATPLVWSHAAAGAAGVDDPARFAGGPARGRGGPLPQVTTAISSPSRAPPSSSRSSPDQNLPGS